MVVAKKWIMSKHFEGAPKHTDLQLVEETLPEITEGEFLCEAVVLSVDPYMRLFGNTVPIGGTFLGEQVAKILESRNVKFSVGAFIAINCGWRSHTISKGDDARLLPEMSGLPVSLALGTLGMPGGTAYFGLYEVCGARSGDVVFVNGAAGAVGSTVGQLAKAKGCTVIGCAGTEEKLSYLRDIGFDHVFNYRSRSLDDALTEYAADGIDVFFDNVGGEATLTVFKRMKSHGRVAICGTISGYNDASQPGGDQKGVLPYHTILMKELKVTGFTFWSFMARRGESEDAVRDLIKEGKLKYHEIIVKGFENMTQAFLDVLSGKSLGKTVVMAASDGEIPTYTAP